MKRGLVVSLAVQGALACSPATIASAPVDAGSETDAMATMDAGDAGVSIARACADNAFARCSLLQTCSTSALEFRFGDLRTCQALYQQSCLGIMNAPSSGQSIAGIEACVQELSPPASKWSCGDYLFNQNPPPDCQVPAGALANGAPCALSQQCQSAFCSIADGKMCGTCAPALQAGDSCAGLAGCPRTYSCVTASQKCQGFVNMGGSCSPSLPCAASLMCVGYSAQSNAPGTCQPEVSTPHAACSFGGAGCDVFAGLSCNAQTQTCETAQIVGPGVACGLVANQQAYCASAGTCVDGQCQGSAPVGAPCDLVAGPACITLARCIVDADGGTSGTCQVSNASSCR
jgi:hypothetical protein